MGAGHVRMFKNVKMLFLQKYSVFLMLLFCGDNFPTGNGHISLAAKNASLKTLRGGQYNELVGGLRSQVQSQGSGKSLDQGGETTKSA